MAKREVSTIDTIDVDPKYTTLKGFTTPYVKGSFFGLPANMFDNG